MSYKFKSLKHGDGFTIIEVIIVLVIAAVIMLMVFLVVPQLQRSQRNTRNQAVARQALAAAEQFAANKNGTYPTTITDIETITGALKNASNQGFTLGTTATPSATEMSIFTNVAECTDSSTVGSILANSGTKYKIVIRQETSSSTASYFCINN